MADETTTGSTTTPATPRKTRAPRPENEIRLTFAFLVPEGIAVETILKSLRQDSAQENRRRKKAAGGRVLEDHEKVNGASYAKEVLFKAPAAQMDTMFIAYCRDNQDRKFDAATNNAKKDAENAYSAMRSVFMMMKQFPTVKIDDVVVQIMTETPDSNFAKVVALAEEVFGTKYTGPVFEGKKEEEKTGEVLTTPQEVNLLGEDLDEGDQKLNEIIASDDLDDIEAPPITGADLISEEAETPKVEALDDEL